jgi:hypothetical protein
MVRQKQGKGQIVEIAVKELSEKWLFFLNIEKKRWILGGLGKG